MKNENNLRLDPFSGDTILFRSCLSSHVNQFVFSFPYLEQMRKGELFYHLSGIPAVIIYGARSLSREKSSFFHVMNSWKQDLELPL